MKSDMKYKLADGTEVPLFEGEYDTAFTVYKSDKRKATIGDPRECIEAKGLCRLPNVIEACIGSGKDAYIVYKGTPSRDFKHALHFTIPARSEKVRDAFDTKRGLNSQILMLKAPTKGRTLKHRRKLSRSLQARIKNGTHTVKPGKSRKQRVHRLGVARRPKAKVTDHTVEV
jgi:hypothetical protein